MHTPSTHPEVTDPVRGDVVRPCWPADHGAGRAARLEIPQAQQIRLYKNNTDNRALPYGTRELLDAAADTVPGDRVHDDPFFISRQVIAGAGRVGIGRDGKIRASDHSSAPTSSRSRSGWRPLETSIINTRDEPHADPEQYRRLHVIVGDANLSEYATYLKMGITSLVLSMIEHQWDFSAMAVNRPVHHLHAVSHDPDLRHEIELADGRRLTAVQMQAEFAETGPQVRRRPLRRGCRRPHQRRSSTSGI